MRPFAPAASGPTPAAGEGARSGRRLPLAPLRVFDGACPAQTCRERKVILRALCEAAGRHGKGVDALSLGDYQRVSRRAALPSPERIRRAFGSFERARASVLAAVTLVATGVEQKPARSPAAPRPGMPQDGSDACAVGRCGEPDNRDAQEVLNARP